MSPFARSWSLSLELYTQFFFSGLLLHGGTLASDNEDIPGWAYRTVVISYPPSFFVLGNIKHSFVALSFDREPFYLTQEMTNTPHYTETLTVYSNQANFANNVAVIMKPEAYFDFFVCGLLQSTFFFLCQLPDEYKIKVDSEAWLRSISIESESGLQSTNNWLEALNSDIANCYGTLHKDIQDSMLHDLFDQGVYPAFGESSSQH